MFYLKKGKQKAANFLVALCHKGGYDSLVSIRIVVKDNDIQPEVHL
jgi:hypothetical protein